MERVYLLLRNNQQTGPFTIGELLQQQLKPSDMIWVEGKSAAWTYLSELELTPFTKDVEVCDHNQDLKSEDEIERKAEQLRQRVLASAPRTYFPKYVTEIETYASSYKRPEEQIQFVDHRKQRNMKRNTVFGEFFLTCIVIGLFMVGIYKGKSFLGVKEKVQNSVATQLDSGDQHTAQKTKPVSQVTILPNDTTVNEQHDSLVALQKTIQKVSPIRKHVIDSLIQSKPLNTITANQEDRKEDTQTAVHSSVKKDDLSKKELIPAVPEIRNAEPVKEEKKGFLKGLFKKKKKDDNSGNDSKE